MQKVKISEVCKITNGYAFKSDNYVTNDGARVIRITNVQKGKIVDNDPKLYPYSELSNLDNYKIDENDILMSLTGNVGRVGKFPKELLPAYINQRVCRIKPKSDNLSDNYLYHFLNSDIFENDAIRNSAGAAQLNLSTNWVLDYEIPLPDLPTQQKIAAILDKADELRQYNQQLIEKYDALTQSLFLEMFGDPINNPKKWKVNKLKEISTKIHSGNTPKGGSEVYVDKGITFFRSQNVWKNKLVYEDIAFIDQLTHDKMLKSSLKHGDILMTKTGRINTENSSLGRAAMYLGEDDKANINGHVYLIRLKKDIINEFVLHILTTKEYRGYIRSVCVGGIDKRQLNKEHIEEFPILNPPIELQNQFAERIQVIETQKQKAQEALAKSEALFQGLLQQAFKGELH
ncbi:restriction endonuclease subunit S [Flavobacterium sedimenticola]|uniref:Restriction endonuclease subunit S n=1 Tax=Flavobacterium sedimenticola TaxID=3043286 RepID=A0ABT6XSY4_9FLAO|nr:restriction endonuclease subunit S [Flavobacterium sedimenticola]MDI9258186.1 restriction endonuclease subunit S [Flavobacterium sedimenticola]